MATLTSLGFTIFSRYDGSGVTRASRDLNDLNRTLERNTGSLNSFTGRMGALITVTAAFAPALAPISTAVAGVTAATAAMGATAGSALGIYGIAMKGAIAQTLKMAEAGKSLSPVQSAFVHNVNNMKSAWNQFIQATQGMTLTTATVAVQGVTAAIARLEPAVRAVHPILQQVAVDFRSWAEGAGFQRFIDTVIKFGVPALRSLVAAGKDVLATLGIGFRAFAPLGVSVAQALERGAAAMRAWAEGGGFARFIERMQAIGPSVASFFRSLVDALHQVSVAMGGLGPLSLGLATALLTIIAHTPVPVLQAIIVSLAVYRVAMLAAAAATWLTATSSIALNAGLVVSRIGAMAMVAAAIAQAVASGVATVATAAWAAATWLLNAALAVLLSPIFLVIAAVAALGYAIFLLVDNWTLVWNTIKNVFLTVVDFLKNGLNGFAQLLLLVLGPVGILAIIALNWSTIWNAMKVAAIAVWNALTVAWNAFIGALATAWTAVSGALVVAWNAVWNAMGIAARAVWLALQVAWSAFISALAVAWTAVSGALVVAWNAVWNAIALVARTLWAAMQAAWSAFITGLAVVWSTVSSALVAAWNAVWNGMSVAVRAIWTGLQTAWSAFLNAMNTVGTAVLNAIRTAWTTVWNGISAAARAVWNAMQAAYHAVVTAISNATTASLNFMRNAWSTIWNAISTAARALWTALSNTYHSVVTFLSNQTTTALNFIRNLWSTVWNAISAAARALWTALSNAYHAVVTFLSNQTTSALNFIRNAWSTIWNAIKSAVQAIWNAMQTAFHAFVTAVSNVCTTALNFIKARFSDAWNSIKSTAQTVWNAIKGVIEGAIKGILTPVNFLIKGFNNITKALGMKLSIPEIKVNFAYGGMVGGPPASVTAFSKGGMNLTRGGAVGGYAPGRDRIPAMLSPGEGVLTPEAVRGLGGPGFVHSANRTWAGHRGAGKGARTLKHFHQKKSRSSNWHGGNPDGHFAKGGMAQPLAQQAMQGAIGTDGLMHYLTGTLTAQDRAGLAKAGISTSLVSQGSFSTSVEASGSTHAGDGVVDLATTSPAVLAALRAAGWAAWIRGPAQGFSPHIHAVLMGASGLSGAAQAQVADFLKGGDGLGLGGSGDGGGGIGDMFGPIIENAGKILRAIADGSGLLGAITKFAGGAIGDLLGGGDKKDDGGGILGSGIGPDVGPDILPDIGGAISSAIGDMVKGVLMSAITPPVAEFGLGVFKDKVPDSLPGGVFGKAALEMGSKLFHGGADWISGKAKELAPDLMADFGGAGFAGGGVQQWAGLAAVAMKLGGLNPNQLGKFLALMQAESGGNPMAINLTDSNAAAGMASRGLMQVIPPTFAAYHVAGTSSNIFDPLANMAAAAAYIKAVYGGNVPGSPYALGTPGATSGWHQVGERGPEWVKFRGGEKVLRNGELPPMSRDHGGDHIEFSDGCFRFNFNGPVSDEQLDRVEHDLVPKLRMAVQAGVGKRTGR